jgi:UPF0271 protein
MQVAGLITAGRRECWGSQTGEGRGAPRIVVPFCFVQFAAIGTQPPHHVDLNADVGESFGAYAMGDDAGLMSSVTSASVAAGFHGGDPSVLRRTIRLAAARGISVGVHPGLPDLAGFGRRELRLTPAETEDLVLYQIAAVAGVAAAEGVRVRHVKPHGALYNMAAKDPGLAAAIAAAVRAFDGSLVLFGPPGSTLLEAGRAAGLTTAAEGFADRAYAPDGSLAPRQTAGAVIPDPAVVAARVVRMVRQRTVVALDGSVLPLAIETVCVHGDTPGAAAIAAHLRRALEAEGIAVRALERP